MLIYGKALWAAIQTPNTKYEPTWSIDVIPDDDSILDELEGKGFKIKTSKEGERHVTFKRKCVNWKGVENKQPRLLDAHKNPIDVQVGNGSNVVVQYEEYYGSSEKYGSYQGLELKAVQVIDLIEYGYSDGDEFENFDPESEL